MKAPAQNAVSYEKKLFGTFTTVSKYSGPPSDEVDAAWNDLYLKRSSSRNRSSVLG